MITTIFLFVITFTGGVKDVDKYQMPDWNTCMDVAQEVRIDHMTTVTAPDGTITQTITNKTNVIVLCGEKTRKCHKWEVCP